MMMKKIIILITFLIMIISSNILFSQYQNILISNQYNPNETFIAINPKNTNQIVAGSNIFYIGSDTSISGYYYSSNGGSSWNRGVLHSTVARPSGDPVVIVDTAGNFYFIQISNWNIPPAWDKLLIMKSTNAGVNWSNGITFGKNGTKMQDKPWACVDWSNSIWRNNIYICWTQFDVYHSHNPLDSTVIMFTHSTDCGSTFSTPIRISRQGGNALDSALTVEGASPCTGPEGQIYVTWGGNNKVTFNKSNDGGINWLGNEITVSQTTVWTFPTTACDISNSSYRGNVYTCFDDCKIAANDRDVWISKSTNGGNNWNTPVRVNNDSSGNYQFFGSMCIDQTTGYLWVVYYDNRDIPSYMYNVYVARSTDGGETFQNEKVSSTPFTSGGFIGDYITIAAHNGHVRPMWTRQESSYDNIYTAVIDTFPKNVQEYSHLNSCSTGNPKSINDLQFTYDTINISQRGKIKDIKLSLNINHTNDGDLFIKLINQSNSVVLSQFNGIGGQNYTNTIFDDTASLSITQGTPPFTGRFRPQGILFNLNEQQLAGNWILQIYDSKAGDQGTLLNWCLQTAYENQIGIKEINSEIPDKFMLFQNYPNPFNPSTIIRFQIKDSRFVTLKIYDILGKEVATLVNEKLQPGVYEVPFSENRLSSGIYLYILESGDFREIKKMMLIK